MARYFFRGFSEVAGILWCPASAELSYRPARQQALDSCASRRVSSYTLDITCLQNILRLLSVVNFYRGQYSFVEQQTEHPCPCEAPAQMTSAVQIDDSTQLPKSEAIMFMLIVVSVLFLAQSINRTISCQDLNPFSSNLAFKVNAELLAFTR